MTEIMDKPSEVIATEKLKSFVERAERLEEQKTAIAEDMKEVFREARFHGFDVAIMKKVIRMRAMDSGKLAEQEQLIDLYREALGL
jgi:uncharacterized protein (UPF0335 family)